MNEKNTKSPLASRDDRGRIVPREAIVRDTLKTLEVYTLNLTAERGLTPAEEIYVVNEAARRRIASIANVSMREERREAAGGTR